MKILLVLLTLLLSSSVYSQVLDPPAETPYEHYVRTELSDGLIHYVPVNDSLNFSVEDNIFTSQFIFCQNTQFSNGLVFPYSQNFASNCTSIASVIDVSEYSIVNSTMSMWVNLDSGQPFRMFNEFLSVSTGYTSGIWKLSFEVAAVCFGPEVFISTNIDSGVVNVVLTRQNGFGSLYINGELMSTLQDDFSCLALMINEGYQFGFSGLSQQDEMSIWSRILTQEEITSLYEAGTNEITFIRGDVNEDGSIDVTDPIVALDYIYGVIDAPSCLQSLDVDADDLIGIGDALALLSYVFGTGSPPPVFPFPSCGVSLPDTFTCLQHSACP